VAVKAAVPSEARTALAKAFTAGGPQAPLLFLVFFRERIVTAWAETRDPPLGILGDSVRSAAEDKARSF
jgi:hypothetical protein